MAFHHFNGFNEKMSSSEYGIPGEKKISTWNAKCPIFLGNFTPRTSNYCLKKIGHLAFQVGKKQRDLDLVFFHHMSLFFFGGGFTPVKAQIWRTKRFQSWFIRCFTKSLMWIFIGKDISYDIYMFGAQSARFQFWQGLALMNLLILFIFQYCPMGRSQGLLIYMDSQSVANLRASAPSGSVMFENASSALRIGAQKNTVM